MSAPSSSSQCPHQTASLGIWVSLKICTVPPTLVDDRIPCWDILGLFSARPIKTPQTNHVQTKPNKPAEASNGKAVDMKIEGILDFQTKPSINTY